ncbi:MAG TPA: M48 family metalloprotease, partial [Nitriliruptorales bacterium]|nr:M48 family metalloprotease [Nitriliruptorales bacterium]
LQDWPLQHAPTWALVGLGAAGLAAAWRRWPRSWHWRTVVAGTVLAAAISLLGPFVFDPLVTATRPLPSGPLRDAVVSVAQRAGYPSEPAVIAGSRSVTEGGAHVAGLGPSQRILVNEALLGLPPEQAAVVVAHEVAHAEHADVVRSALFTATGLFAGLWLSHRLLHSPVVRRAVAARSGSDPRLVPVVVAVAAVGTLLAAPVTNLESRIAETAADERALELTGDPATVVRLHRRLVVSGLSDPTPPAWFRLLFGTHPPTAARIRQAVAYAGEKDAPLPSVTQLVAQERSLWHRAIRGR